MRSGYAKLFGAVTSKDAAHGMPRMAKRGRGRTALEEGSPGSASSGHADHSLHSDSEAKHEVCAQIHTPRARSPAISGCMRSMHHGWKQSREGYTDTLVWAMQPEAIWDGSVMQVKRSATSRLGQAIGQLARVSIHMSESEGHRAARRHGRRHRKERMIEDAASGDDVSSQASASSATQQHLKACSPCLRTVSDVYCAD